MSWLPEKYDFAIASTAAWWIVGDLSIVTDDISAAAVLFALLDTGFDTRTVLASLIGALGGFAFRAATK